MPEWYANHFCAILSVLNALFIAALIDLTIGPVGKWIYGVLSIPTGLGVMFLNYRFFIKDWQYVKIQEEYAQKLEKPGFLGILMFLYIVGSFIAFPIVGQYARDMYLGDKLKISKEAQREPEQRAQERQSFLDSLEKARSAKEFQRYR